MGKINLDQIKKIQLNSEVVMGETLAGVPADGLTIEEAFQLYIDAMNWAEGDKFYRQIPDGDIEEITN